MIVDYDVFTYTNIDELVNLFKLSYDSYKKTYVCNSSVSDDLFDTLKEEYPYSGVEEYLSYAISSNRDYYYRTASLDVTNAIYTRQKIFYYKLYSMMPCVEQLVKAGFQKVIASLMPYGYYWNFKFPATMFKRNFKNGSNIKEICGIPKYAYEYFKSIGELGEWNEARIMVNKHLNTKEKFNAFANLNVRYNARSFITKAKTLLNTGSYTPETLFRYLDRVDMYQAIEPDEAVMYLKDYISMCGQCGVKPDVFTNNLKKEHDLMSRNCRTLVDKESIEKFNEQCEKYKHLEYSANGYTLVAPKTADDMILAAKQQRNCMASYIKPVAEGSSIILFIESEMKPGKYIAAIELNPSTYDIRQQYMAYNKPVVNKNILKMLEKYKNHICNDIKGAA